MSDGLKVGDRVRTTRELTDGSQTLPIGAAGVILAIEGELWPYRVRLDDYRDSSVDGYFVYSESELELMEEGPKNFKEFWDLLEQGGGLAEVPDDDPVTSPAHYRNLPNGLQVIDITRNMGFLDGNVIKYVLRAPYKGNEVQDLKKARQYLDWLIEEKEKSA